MAEIVVGKGKLMIDETSKRNARSKNASAKAGSTPLGGLPNKAEMVASFIRKNYSYMVFSMVFLGILAGLTAPAQVQLLKSFMLPLTGVMVWAMTVTIRFKELAQIVRKIRQIILGLLFSYVFFPVICFILAMIFLLPRPEWAAGFILMGSVPCAGMNVVWTGMLKGDVPLSLMLNAIMMFLGIATIPTITAFLAGVYVRVSVADLLWSVLINLVIPLFFGFLTRYVLEARLGKNLPKYLPIFSSISAVIAMILMFSMVSINIPMIPGEPYILLSLMLPSLLVFPLVFGVPYLICLRALHLKYEEHVAIVYSSGMKHLPLATGLAFTSFGSAAAFPIVISAVFQTTFASIFYRLFQRFIEA
jgi:ACR3 family arsenite efflux pump ArsB